VSKIIIIIVALTLATMTYFLGARRSEPALIFPPMEFEKMWAGAQPLGQALTECKAKVRTVMPNTDGDIAFFEARERLIVCMATRGWMEP
jgi:hypothetical protein